MLLPLIFNLYNFAKKLQMELAEFNRLEGKQDNPFSYPNRKNKLRNVFGKDNFRQRRV